MSMNIVLLEPEMPANTGNIGRTCVATGTKLHLIKPLGFSLEDKYLKRAGLDYWRMMRYEVHENFEELLEKYKDDLVYVKSIETGKKYPIGIKLEKNAWVKETGWYPDTCVVGLAEGLKNKDLAVKFIEENILED